MALLVSMVAACGDKVPESAEAKKLGNIPKQTIDNTRANVNKALETGAQRARDEDEKIDKQ